MLLRAEGCWLHGLQIDAVGGGEVIQALGHAPRCGTGMPLALLLAQSSNQFQRILLDVLELISEVHDIRSPD